AVYDQWYGEFDEKRQAFKRQSLATAAARHGVSVEGAHRALADCKMVLAVLEKVGYPVLQIETVAEKDLPPCPFCYGPPSLFTTYLSGKDYKPLYQPVIYGHDGLYVSSFVFCHECGAQGEEIEGHVYDDSDVDLVEAAARNVWSDRNERHRDLYVSSLGDE
uniref:Lar family restriction alleviation protein n=2 Tax=Enterobacter TaxID=547 RepID=UPI00203A5CB9